MALALPCRVPISLKAFSIALQQHSDRVHTLNVCSVLQVSNSLKAVRDRINSVKNTQKITDAMKLVAAAKVRRAQDAVINGRPFSENLVKVSSDHQSLILPPDWRLDGCNRPAEQLPEDQNAGFASGSLHHALRTCVHLRVPRACSHHLEETWSGWHLQRSRA